MPTSVRLDPETLSELERIARVRELSKSDVIREAIHAYGAEIASPPRDLAEAMAPWIGCLDSGGARLTESSREKIVAAIRKRGKGGARAGKDR